MVPTVRTLDFKLRHYRHLGLPLELQVRLLCRAALHILSATVRQVRFLIGSGLDRLALRNAVVKTTDAFDLATTPEQAMAFLTEWQVAGGRIDISGPKRL